MNWQVIQGDCLEVMRGMDAGSFDAVITDPPYELGFMGKHWDAQGVAFQVATWQAVYRVLKPGASLVAFGGTRTHHRLMCAIEDAGFEIRDCLMWLYGSGFPKSLDISKAIDKAAGAERPVIGSRKIDIGIQSGLMHAGRSSEVVDAPITAPATALAQIWQGYGTALKPAYEPIVWAMKPLDGTFAANAEKHGVAGVNIEAGRIPTAPGDYDHPGNSGIEDNTQVYGRFANKNQSPPATAGRFPANLLLDEAAAKMLDEQSGERPASHNQMPSVAQNEGLIYGHYNSRGYDGVGKCDSGGASRFFYCAKASRAERERGLEGCEEKSAAERTGREPGSAGLHTTSRPNVEGGNPYAGQSSGKARNHHPTVKPLALMRYLLTLFDTPMGGRVLDPFLGSGTTGVACAELGREFVGIEREAEYAEIARKRIEAATRQTKLFTPEREAVAV